MNILGKGLLVGESARADGVVQIPVRVSDDLLCVIHAVPCHVGGEEEGQSGYKQRSGPHLVTAAALGRASVAAAAAAAALDCCGPEAQATDGFQGKAGELLYRRGVLGTLRQK